MTTFRKMALVSEDELLNFKNKSSSEDELLRMKQKEIREYNPEIRTLSFVQSEIDDLLNNKDLNIEDKLLLIQSAQKRFTQLAPTRLNGNMQTTKVKEIINTIKIDDSVAQDRTKSIASKHVLPSIPAKSHAKANQILDVIRKNPDIISVNEDMGVTINGDEIPTSNFLDLLRNLYAPRKIKPSGYNDFLTALHSLNIDPSLISDSKAKHIINSLSDNSDSFYSAPTSDHSSSTSTAPSSSSSSKTIITKKQSGEGLFKPPGKPAKILRLYRN